MSTPAEQFSGQGAGRGPAAPRTGVAAHRVASSTPPRVTARPLLPDGSADLEALTRSARPRRAEQDLFFFARAYFPAFFPDPPAAFHREIVKLALEASRPRRERSSEGLVIAAPRGHAKSTMLSFLLPLYWIVRREKHFIVIVSETAAMAETFVNTLKQELEENARLREDFGLVCGDRIQSGRRLRWTSGDFTVALVDAAGKVVATVRVLARSTSSQFRGLKDGAHRPDAVICDDLENDELVASPEMRTKTWNWFSHAVVPALDPHTGSLLVIGTILHYDSLLAKLLNLGATTGVYTTRIYRALSDTGGVLWPERFSREALAEKQAQIGTLAFNCEYLNRPIDDSTRIFRPAWIRWYTGHELEYDAHRRRWMFRGEPLEIVVGVDPAISERERADNFAYVVIGVARQQKVQIILQAFAGRLDFPAQVQEIIRLEATWQPRQIGIEDSAYQRALPQQLLKESLVFGTKIKRLSNGQTHKYIRIQRASVPFENGLVYLRAALDDEAGEWDELGQRRVHSLMQPLYTELMQYPANAHDDVLDAMENAFQLATVKPRLFEGFDAEDD